MNTNGDRDLAEVFVAEVAKVVHHWTSVGESILNGQGDPTWSEHAAEYSALRNKLADPALRKALSHLIHEIGSGTAFSVLALIDGDRDFPRCNLVDSETGKQFGGGGLHERFSDAEIRAS